MVNLEHCLKLDEECLEAVLRRLVRAEVVLLKGTCISKRSDVLMNANVGREKKIDFVFSDACKCCGRYPRIKELPLNYRQKING